MLYKTSHIFCITLYASYIIYYKYMYIYMVGYYVKMSIAGYMFLIVASFLRFMWKQTLRLWDLCANLSRRALGNNTCCRGGVEEAGFGRGKGWAAMQPQQMPQPIIWGALGLGWPFRIVPTEMGGARLLCSCICQSSASGGGIILQKANPCWRG